MALHKRGRFWHYEFQVNGTRYRGSTKQTTQTRARQIEVRKMQEAQENGYSALPKKALLPQRLESDRNYTTGQHEAGPD